MPSLFVFGYGYAARRVGARLLGRGWSVAGTCTTTEKGQEVRGLGVEPLIFDGEAPSLEIREALRWATHVLVSIPPSEGGDPALIHHRSDLVEASSVHWVGYLSTTGVYGDRGGGAVDETTEPDPGTERSRRRVEAEAGWRRVAEARGATLQIFRLSGIYGPGRSALDRIRDGSARRLVSPELVFNRIHVDDIAGAVVAGMDRPEITGVFNLSDDEPASPARVVEYAAELLGVDPPEETPLQEASLSPTARSFYEENKRVGNGRLKTELGYRLQYPTYREGLAQIASGGG